MKTYVLMASLLFAVIAHANTVRVYQTDHDPAEGEPSFTYTSADLVGQFQSNLLDFTNWHPYGLDYFAVEITGLVYSNAPTRAYFMGCASSSGWYDFEIGGWGYATYYDIDTLGNIMREDLYVHGELEFTPGLSPFLLRYQTSPYSCDITWGISTTPMDRATFRSNLPYYGWGADPDAIGYTVTPVSVADEPQTIALLLMVGLPCVGLVAVRRFAIAHSRVPRLAA